MSTRRRRYEGPSIPADTYLEVLHAMHLSAYVESPFQQRGGLMVVGPPGAWKSSALHTVADAYSDALELSDVNAQSLNRLKERVAAGNIRTLILPEFAKLYERANDTAANVEGTLRAMVAEGFRSASFQDPEVARFDARAFVFGAMTEATRDGHWEKWHDSGFSRRFLWSLVKLRNAFVFEEAVERWQLVDVRVAQIPRPPATGYIPNLTTRVERARLRHLVKHQPVPHELQVQVLAKTLAVLKWWRRQRRDDPRRALATLEVFARSLGAHGAQLTLNGER